MLLSFADIGRIRGPPPDLSPTLCCLPSSSSSGLPPLPIVPGGGHDLKHLGWVRQGKVAHSAEV